MVAHLSKSCLSCKFDDLTLYHYTAAVPGPKFLTDEQAKEVGDANWRHSHATHDLYNTIELGDYPEWEFFIQTMNPADENNFYFDPLDCTKVGQSSTVAHAVGITAGMITADKHSPVASLRSSHTALCMYAA